MRILPLVLEMLPVGEIRQHPENPNNGDMDAIEESIEVNGFFDPIHVQRSTGYIIAGNHRYLAVVKAGHPVIPAIVHDVDDLAALRMMVTHNQTGRLGFDDEAMMANVLEQLHHTDIGLAGTGFEADDYARLMELVNEPLTADDFEMDEEAGMAPIERGHWSLMPVVSEDGTVEAISLTRPNLHPITLRDFHQVRAQLGLNPLTKTQIETYGVPDWDRR